MNAGLEEGHASIDYYDSDYPSPLGEYAENFDEVTALQGLSHDLQRYVSLANETGGPVLEACCGTGRVGMALLSSGLELTGIDISRPLLKKFEEKLAKEEPAVRRRCQLSEQDITRLELKTPFQMAIMAFNSLLCIPNFDDQLSALSNIRKYLVDGGTLALDIVNPLKLKLQGDPTPKPFFTRRSTKTGNTYTRFAACDAINADQKQRLHGWYDEIDQDGLVHRKPYSMYWRPIFRFEIELMLWKTGFQIERLEGGHLKEPFSAESPRMFIIASAT